MTHTYSHLCCSAGTKPSAPVIIEAEPSDGSVTVFFRELLDVADSGGYPITDYVISCQDDKNNYVRRAAIGKGSPIVVRGLKNLTTYKLWVHAVNDMGEGPDSSPSEQVWPGEYGARVSGNAWGSKTLGHVLALAQVVS